MYLDHLGSAQQDTPGILLNLSRYELRCVRTEARHLRLRKARITDPVDIGSEYALPTRIERAAVLALEEALYGAWRADVLAIAARRSWTH